MTINPHLANTKPVKILCIANQGDGKTCSTASLALMGYNLRILDCDKGSETLLNLLNDAEHYPHAKFLIENGIDISNTISIIPIDSEMILGEIEKSTRDPRTGKILKTQKEFGLKPKNTQAFTQIGESLMNWDDGKKKHGSIYTWDSSTVFVWDTISKGARFAYYYNQGINNRLGHAEEGWDHNRDVGGAQTWLRKIIEVLFSSSVKCNVLIFAHIDWIDLSRGYAQSPQERDRNEQPLNLTGVPKLVGKAFGAEIGSYFNNTFCIRSEGQERKIWTIPIDKIKCKRVGWLKDSYPQSTGMAEIFSQINGIPLPQGMLELFSHSPPAGPPTPALVPQTPSTNGSHPRPYIP